MNSTHFERNGELMVLGQSMIYGLFPVILTYSGGKIPPVFFAATSTFLSGVIILLYLLKTQKIDDLRERKAYPYLFRLTLFIVLGYTCFYIGGSQTTGINTSILAQAEIVFTFLFAGLLFGESMPTQKLVAAMFVLVGTLLIVYNGVVSINPGDLYILAATAIFPFANRNAQQAMKHISPQAVLVVRSLLASVAFFLISFWWEGTLQTGMMEIRNNWSIILFNGVVIFSLTKVMWYEGLRRVELSKAITLGMTFTAFGLLYSMLLLKEQPTLYQLLGFLIVMIGVYVITRKNHIVLPSVTENP